MCIALGRTPRQLERELTLGEFNELLAFELLEPYGAEAQTDNFRMIAALIHAANFKVNGGPLKPSDFMTRYEPPEIAEERRIYEQALRVKAFFERRLKKE